MASTEDDASREARLLADFARTTEWNLYTMLELPDPFSPSSSSTSPSDEPLPLPTNHDLRTARRRVARKHHPDKNIGHETAAAERLDQCTRAYNVLIDPDARAVYDARRRAETARRAERHAMDAKRRRMVEQLEEGERRAREGEVREREKKVYEGEMARKRREYVEGMRREERDREDERLDMAEARARARDGGARRSVDDDEHENRGGPVLASEAEKAADWSSFAFTPAEPDGLTGFQRTMARMKEYGRAQREFAERQRGGVSAA